METYQFTLVVHKTGIIFNFPFTTRSYSKIKLKRREHKEVAEFTKKKNILLIKALD